MAKKITMTLCLLFVYRLIYYIPLPGIDTEILNKLMAAEETIPEYFSFMSAGISAYLTAWAILTLFFFAKDVITSRYSIKEYSTFYLPGVVLTVLMCVAVGGIAAKSFSSPIFIGQTAYYLVSPELTKPFLGPIGLIYPITILCFTVGTFAAILIALGINKHGVGNGFAWVISLKFVFWLPYALMGNESKTIVILSSTFLTAVLLSMHYNHRSLKISLFSTQISLPRNNNITYSIVLATTATGFITPFITFLFLYMQIFNTSVITIFVVWGAFLLMIRFYINAIELCKKIPTDHKPTDKEDRALRMFNYKVTFSEVIPFIACTLILHFSMLYSFSYKTYGVYEAMLCCVMIALVIEALRKIKKSIPEKK